MDLGLEGKVAVVTGASRGIGRQIAADLGREGCRLVLCARGREGLDRAVGELVADGVDAVGVVADLRDPPAAGLVADTAQERCGQVDILVNNAGLARPKRLLALSDAEWHESFELNFFAAVRLSAACAPSMVARRWGRIVNIVSTSGKEPDPYFGPYSAARAALINLTKTYARALSADGVLTNCVVPGITDTEMVRENASSAAAAGSITVDEVMDRMLAKDPIATGRIGHVEEISAAVVFLASERASWITGTALVADGGTLRSI